MCEESKDSSPSSTNLEEAQTVPGSTERKRRGSKDILDTKLTSSKKKRKPQDQLNPVFEHRSWCAWISKSSRESPAGWRHLLELLISHNERVQSSRSPQKGLSGVSIFLSLLTPKRYLFSRRALILNFELLIGEHLRFAPRSRSSFIASFD